MRYICGSYRNDSETVHTKQFLSTKKIYFLTNFHKRKLGILLLIAVCEKAVI